MSTQKNLITLCFAAVFTLGLAACGGGGGGGAPVADMPGTMIEPPEPHACDAGASQECVDARKADLDAIENDSEATVGALNAAEMALTDAETNLANANTAMMEETTVSGLVDDAMTATTDITDESTLAEVAVGRAAIDAAKESLAGMENLSAEVTETLQDQIDTLESGFSSNEMAVRTAAATAAAATKLTELGVEAGETGVDDASLGGTGERAIVDGDRTDGAYALSIERDRMATTVTVTVQGTTVDDDVEFMEAKDFGDGRTMHTRTMEADPDGSVMQEIAIVYTDIDPPKATLFATEYPFDANPIDPEAAADDLVNQSLKIDGTNLAMIATDGITAVGAGPITVLSAVEDDAATPVDDTVAAFETDATFDGAPGTLKCAGGAAGCTVTLDADGDITAFGDGWEFTPADGATATVDVDDTDYLHYGFWLKTTTDKDGATTYNEVETFAGSRIAVSGSVVAVTGSATYEGGAVGVYVRETFKSTTDSSIDTATSGHFTADATLEATFGQVDAEGCEGVTCGTIAPILVNTLAGTIDNFVLQHEEYNEWSVNLQGDITADMGTVVGGTANGGGDPGTFNATFHGPNVDAADPPAPIQPHTVVGEFNANFGNGAVAGGFGARKQ